MKKKSKYNLWTQKRNAELARLGKGPEVNRSMNSTGTGSDGISFKAFQTSGVFALEISWKPRLGSVLETREVEILKLF